ncbi:hypothetical protein B0A50_00980 [Salinomyces thailandicus]|uniref:Zn(2)-C6 fungal-type domain-containing protein n=1 Tax=Salinomyces thailandicus TaxID=706561 RepID=A0A4U0UEF8_9PEZI|nr:hypothetical protein B0A50_00980 [Salinomyces thailandica]
MTSAAVLTAAEPSLEPQTAAAPPPRKRRRRTAAGGATDDCFTCSKRSVKCDRKRPYCTQCIDIGKECSGYKTTLTWGVGVASRGKLRGLSCPIAGKDDGINASPPEAETRRRKTSVSKMKCENGSANGLSSQSSLAPLPPITQARVPSLQPPSLPMPIPHNQNQWQTNSFNDHQNGRRDSMRQDSFQLPPLQHLQTSFSAPYDFSGYPQTAMSMGSYAETEYHSPPEYPRTPVSMHIPQSVQLSNLVEQAEAERPANANMIETSAERKGEVMDHGASGDHPEHAFNKGSTDAMSVTLYDGNSLDFEDFDFATDLDEDHSGLSLIDPRFSSPFFHLAPRMQSLMEYYDLNICPFLVAFDGDQNPYRKHILQLAFENEGLQNAIAALSTNNMRMRKKERPTGGFISELADGQESDVTTDEEALYKQSSIDHLNAQLSNPMHARSDSVLATLLILCLFHVCDSGFSKFKTQLAGVQKLLSLRTPSQQAQSSKEFSQWVEMFFAWFDVMTSAVNDREMQIQGESLDMLDFSANLGALEQFSGCDGRLFKLIARLGRLNLLSQGRPVKSNNGAEQRPSIPRTRSRDGKKKRMFVKRHRNRMPSPSDYDNVDGNGWGTPIISSDEDADGSADEETVPRDLPDNRREFWQEWKEVRSRLEAWKMDSSDGQSASEPTQLDAGQRDLVHINESFRYSALLYTERLGHPVLPSSHQQFQDLVSKALYHITALPVTSCVNKFLLWPLFITGTECVDAGHRSIVRDRCIEIQKESGFFNNISGLEVLEKVWNEYPANGSQGGLNANEEEVRARRRDSIEDGRGYGQALRWRRAMGRKDGEYIVI